MAFSDLLAEILASAMPEPNTDRNRLLLVVLACVVVTMLHAAGTFVTAEGIMPPEWQAHLIALLAVVSAAALVLGAVHLVHRTVGTSLPCICLTVGVAGGWAAWFI